MVRFDVKGKSNLTDAFGIDREEGFGLRGWSNGRVARWADDLIGWIRSVVAEGARGICRKLLSGTTGNRINVEGDSAGPPVPDYIRLETIIGRNSIPPSRSRD